MNALLARFAASKALGLYIDEREVAVTLAAATPLGPVEMMRRSAAYRPDELGNVLQRLLAPFLDRRGRCRFPLALGLPPQRVFFSTRPIRAAKNDASPHLLLQEALQSRDLSTDDMAVDVIRTKPEQRHVASIAACRRKYLTGLLTALQSCGVRPPRTEPGPWALLRAADRCLRAPRQANVVVRLFLAPRQGLAVVAAKGVPVLWRCFDVPAGEELPAIRSVTRALQPLLSFCGLDSPVDTLLVHGTVSSTADRERLEGELGVDVLCCPEPGLDGGDIAFGLAQGVLSRAGDGLDLARPFQLPPAVRDIFPWGEMFLQVAVLLLMGIFLMRRSGDLDGELQTVRAANTRLGVSSLVLSDMENDKMDLTRKVGTIRGFLSGRIPWSAYTDVVAARVPAEVALSSLQGLCQEDSGKQKGAGSKKKSFILQAAAPIADNGAIPEDIHGFVHALRDDPVLAREFPLIELADIKTTRTEESAGPVAFFTVLCLPTKGSGRANPAVGKSDSAATGASSHAQPR